MEEKNNMLDLMIGPCFCVRENIIVQVNEEAAGMLISVGTDIRSLLTVGTEEYTAFNSGCLYLQLNIGGQSTGASVIRIDNQDIFVLDRRTGSAELQALALAAQQLRQPLTSAMVCAEGLLQSQNPEIQEQAERLNRALSQLMRITGNMSDAGGTRSRQEYRDIDALFAEIIEKVQALTVRSGVELTYSGMNEHVLTLANASQLERALLNLLANALKFTPWGGNIRISLRRKNRMIYLTVLDSGSGIADEILGTAFCRYLRQPGLEDNRNGLGLGLVMVRNAAIAHGGTVLVDRPEDGGTRITMTMAIRQNTEMSLRSPMLKIDYTGGKDPVLIELSEVLPPEIYRLF